MGRGRALEDREGGRMLFFLGLVGTLMREWAGGREEEGGEWVAIVWIGALMGLVVVTEARREWRGRIRRGGRGSE